MANTIFDQYKLGLVTGSAAISGTGATDLFVALTSGAYAASEVDPTTAWVAAEVGAAPGYARVNLTGVTVTTGDPGVTTTDNYIKLDADDATWAASTITATGAIVYKGTLSTPGTSICWVDFGGAKSSSTGDFKIIWSANGIIQFKQTAA